MCFSATELQNLKNAVTILQPFEAATTETSAEKFFSISALIPLAKSLMQFVAHSDHEISLVNGLQAQLLCRFGAMEGNCYLAAATAQQGMQWLIQEVSTLSLQTVSDIRDNNTDHKFY